MKTSDTQDSGRKGMWLGWMLGAGALLCLLGGAAAESVLAEEITIAAASDLSFAFKELAAAFEQQTGAHVKLSLGSSGNFFSQIQNGAPFDLYFSADIGFARKLEQSGHAVPGSLYRYAIGRIVVWAPKASPLPIEKIGIEVLRDPTVRKIAIANPKHAPYGRAAVAAMETYKLYDAVKDRLVLGENISQTAQFVESGGCEVGIIALALALAPSMKSAGKYWEIPMEAHPPLEQGAIILKTSKHRRLARQFLDLLKGPQGREIMRRYGFMLPG